MLGCRGTGKTSFVTALSVMSSVGTAGHFQMVPADESTTRFFSSLRALADQHEWPEATRVEQVLNFELAVAANRFHVSLLDYPGEDLEEAFETLDFSARESLQQNLLEADCVLLLVDPVQDLKSALNASIDPVLKRRRQDALAQAVAYIVGRRSEAKKEHPTIAMAITKSDLLGDGSPDAVQHVLEENRSLIEKLRNYARSRIDFKVFGISSSGPVDPANPREYPARPDQAGFTRMFAWIARKASSRATHRVRIMAAIVVSAVLLVVVCVWIAMGVRSDQRKRAFETAPLEGLPRPARMSGSVQQVLDTRIETEITAIRTTLQGSVARAELTDMLNDLAILADLNSSQRKEAEGLRREVSDRLESSLIRLIRFAQESGEFEEALELVVEYYATVPAGQNRTQVEEIEKKIRGEQIAVARSRIRSARRPHGRQLLLARVQLIREYLALDRSIQEAARSETEAALAFSERLARAAQVKVSFKGCGFSSAIGVFKHQLRVRKEEDELTLPSPVQSAHQSTFERDCQIDTNGGKDVFVSLWELNFVNEEVAWRKLNLWQDAGFLDGRAEVPLPNVDDVKRWSKADGWFRAELFLPSSTGLGGWQRVAYTELAAYRKYVCPGDFW